ncbi:hypothetical protein MMC25_001662 [Agyrium rufum]|nr:hypothetical protein [Agyrium rufum]
MAPSAPKVSDAKIVSMEPLKGEEAKWTKLVKITYTDPLNKTRTWESAERATRPANSEIDGVGVLAILHKPTGPELLLQKQFRPPIGKVCIEVPAGLCDEGETGEEAAIRELKEETGYYGEVVRDPREEGGKLGSGIMFNDPGFTNTNTRLIPVTIDPSDPRNHPHNLATSLEENEFIETFSVPLKDLWLRCRELEAEGYAIDARVGGLAEGMRLAAMLESGGGGVGVKYVAAKNTMPAQEVVASPTRGTMEEDDGAAKKGGRMWGGYGPSVGGDQS